MGVTPQAEAQASKPRNHDGAQHHLPARFEQRQKQNQKQRQEQGQTVFGGPRPSRTRGQASFQYIFQKLGVDLHPRHGPRRGHALVDAAKAGLAQKHDGAIEFASRKIAFQNLVGGDETGWVMG